jgi:hypothetical protein
LDVQKNVDFFIYHHRRGGTTRQGIAPWCEEKILDNRPAKFV